MKLIVRGHVDSENVHRKTNVCAGINYKYSWLYCQFDCIRLRNDEQSNKRWSRVHQTRKKSSFIINTCEEQICTSLYTLTIEKRKIERAISCNARSPSEALVRLSDSLLRGMLGSLLLDSTLWGLIQRHLACCRPLLLRAYAHVYMVGIALWALCALSFTWTYSFRIHFF